MRILLKSIAYALFALAGVFTVVMLLSVMGESGGVLAVLFIAGPVALLARGLLGLSNKWGGAKESAKQGNRTALMVQRAKWTQWATTAGIIGSFGYFVWLGNNPTKNTAAWVLGAALFTAVFAVRIYNQERLLAHFKSEGTSSEFGSDERRAYVQTASVVEDQNPMLLRWAHRAIAVGFIWHAALRIADARKKDMVEGVLLSMAPAYAILLIGPLVVFLLILAFPVNIGLLIFYSYGYTLLWLVVLFFWAVIGALKRPTDLRRNVTTAYRWAGGQFPFWFLR